MSIDGPGIVDSDLAHDAYNEILDLYDAGVDVDEIRRRIRSYEDGAVDPIDAEIFLGACVKAFWEIGHLPESLRLSLQAIVDEGVSLAQWADAGDASLASKRKATLNRLLKQTGTPKAKPRARRKYPKISNKLYAVGDCLELVSDTSTYRGVVCKILEYRGQCEYAILVMHPDTVSTRESFASGRYYGHGIWTEHGSLAGPHVIRPEHRMLVRANGPFKIVAHLDLDESKFSLGSFGGVLEMSHVVADFERTQRDYRVFGQQLLPLENIIRSESATKS
jgi:hypothetical protein